MSDLDEILKTADLKMGRAADHLTQEFHSIRTGRATPALLDRLQVDYYGTPTPINGVATVTTPDPRMVVIQPWDKTLLQVIEKAIMKSDLGLNPTNDGQVIRLVLPQLTEDRRRDLVKQVHKRAEEARVAVRNVRRDAMEHVKKIEHDGESSKEDSHRAQERLQKITDQNVHQVDEIARSKEAEVMEI